MAIRRLIAVGLFLTAGRSAAQAVEGEIIFAAYNLENYFQAADFPEGKEKISKAPEAIAAEIRVVQDIHPDILGVCEMGPPNEFQDFKTRLKAAGLDYPNTEYVEGPDPQRHVALLSRLPIASRQSVTDAPFQLDGHEEKVRRGILDVTINAGGTKLRLIGAHLKSKLKDTWEDEAELRRNEAHLLREHIDQALDQDGSARLIVYGDFNDTRNEPALKEIMGVRNSPRGLTDLGLKDSQGDRWTEYWKYQDVYSRIDFILVSHNLLRSVNEKESYVYRSPYWSDASDHRPVVAVFRSEKMP